MLGTTERISDVCLVCRDIDAMIAFYRDRLGFRLRRRAEGFADFASAGVTLALWEARHIETHIGIAAGPRSGTHKVMVAVEVADAATVDARFREIDQAGVRTHGAPQAIRGTPMRSTSSIRRTTCGRSMRGCARRKTTRPSRADGRAPALQEHRRINVRLDALPVLSTPRFQFKRIGPGTARCLRCCRPRPSPMAASARRRRRSQRGTRRCLAPTSRPTTATSA
ncbi:MAG: VOC family protein [Alphaproteobacteria bacterium]